MWGVCVYCPQQNYTYFHLQMNGLQTWGLIRSELFPMSNVMHFQLKIRDVKMGQIVHP